jgi:hypothetical protein
MGKGAGTEAWEYAFINGTKDQRRNGAKARL